MTLDDIKAMNTSVITPAVAARVLECDPHYIRVAAVQCPEQLGFPVSRIGNRTKIPRIPFLRFMGVPEDELTERRMEA